MVINDSMSPVSGTTEPLSDKGLQVSHRWLRLEQPIRGDALQTPSTVATGSPRVKSGIRWYVPLGVADANYSCPASLLFPVPDTPFAMDLAVWQEPALSFRRR
jgi:hypothetical protein